MLVAAVTGGGAFLAVVALVGVYLFMTRTSVKSLKSAPGTLPAGWEEHATDEGEVYYHNTETDETSWERPQQPQHARNESDVVMSGNPMRKVDLEAGVPEASAPVVAEDVVGDVGPADDVEGWEQTTAEDGSTYWYHEASGQTKWSLSD